MYDFNAFDGDDNHWILLPSFDLTSFIADACKFIPNITCDARQSVVPPTLGHRSNEVNDTSPSETCCLVVLFSDGTEEDRASTLIDLLTGQHSVSGHFLSRLALFLLLPFRVSPINKNTMRYLCPGEGHMW